jgi:hypothetical protein
MSNADTYDKVYIPYACKRMQLLVFLVICFQILVVHRHWDGLRDQPPEATGIDFVFVLKAEACPVMCRQTVSTLVRVTWQSPTDCMWV